MAPCNVNVTHSSWMPCLSNGHCFGDDGDAHAISNYSSACSCSSIGKRKLTIDRLSTCDASCHLSLSLSRARARPSAKFHTLSRPVCALWTLSRATRYACISRQVNRRCVTSAREESKRTVVAAGIVFLSLRFICMCPSHPQHSTTAVSPCRTKFYAILFPSNCAQVLFERDVSTSSVLQCTTENVRVRVVYYAFPTIDSIIINSEKLQLRLRLSTAEKMEINFANENVVAPQVN